MVCLMRGIKKTETNASNRDQEHSQFSDTIFRKRSKP